MSLRKPQLVLLVALLCVSLGVCRDAYAQKRPVDSKAEVVLVPIDNPSDPPAWGTSATSMFNIPVWWHQAYSGGPLSPLLLARYSSTGDAVVAPFHLPSGTLITGIQLVGCDTTATDEILFELDTTDTSGATVSLSAAASTGAALTPGCGVFTQLLASPHTVNNSTNSYFFLWNGGPTSATRVLAARVLYKLQVSPAPGTATFADVPVGHPQRPFIEALAASGVTGGCGGGNYCPNDPVTRGQMAVFLAAALGLHWPN